jgi:hypothetical protein
MQHGAAYLRTAQQMQPSHLAVVLTCASCRVTLSITTYHPSSLVEVPPVSLPPLSEALTEQQHQQELDEQQRQVRSAGECLKERDSWKC